MVTPDIRKAVRNYIKVLNSRGFDVKFGVVWGSQVRGTSDQLSDIDLVVVSPRFDRTIVRSDIDWLWQCAARVDSRIEPIPCGEKQWEEDVSSVILESARSYGSRITPDA